MVDFETDPVRHSPEGAGVEGTVFEGQPPFYYVAGRLFASSEAVPEVRRSLSEHDIGDIEPVATSIDGLVSFDFEPGDPPRDNVISVLDALLKQRLEEGREAAGDVAPDYVYWPASHKNVYAADRLRAVSVERDEQMPPWSTLVGLADVGFVDLDIRNERTDLPNSFSPAPPNSTLDADYGHGEFVAWLVTRQAPDAWVIGEDVHSLSSTSPSSQFGAVFDSSLAEAILDLLSRECGIITITVGGSQSIHFPGLLSRAAVATAEADHVLVIAAAGNEGDAVPIFPAALTSVLAVGATTLGIGGWARASYSNYFGNVAVRAPGGHVVPFHSGTYQVFDAAQEADVPDNFTGVAHVEGTSFAVPVIAGAVAHRWANYQALGGSPRERAIHLLEQATDLPDGIRFGPG